MNFNLFFPFLEIILWLQVNYITACDRACVRAWLSHPLVGNLGSSSQSPLRGYQARSRRKEIKALSMKRKNAG